MKLISTTTRIRFMKRMDALIGKYLAANLSPPVHTPVTRIRSILIIRPGGLGDALLLAPAIHRLRDRYPDVLISILAEKRNAAAFSLISTADNVFIYDKYSDLLRLLCSTYDIVIDTEQWHRMSAVIARGITSKIKIGFSTNERSRLFTDPVDYSQADYEAQSFVNLLKPLGIYGDFDESSSFLSVPDNAKAEVTTLMDSFTKDFIAIFPGASIRERRWGAEKFRALVKMIADKGVSSVVVGGKEDMDVGNNIISGTDGLNLAGKTSISGTAAIIARSKALVSGDSGVLHIGVGVGAPTVALFGAGIAEKWAPVGVRHKVLNRGLSCSPCTLFGTTPPCQLNIRCLDEISVLDVYKAVTTLLTGEGTG